jgi:hypothetical protein
VKTIQAVKCQHCNKLLDYERQFVIFDGTVTQQYKPTTSSRKVNLTETVFCDAECLTGYIRESLER